jgi:hypothetical protein
MAAPEHQYQHPLPNQNQNQHQRQPNSTSTNAASPFFFNTNTARPHLSSPTTAAAGVSGSGFEASPDGPIASLNNFRQHQLNASTSTTTSTSLPSSRPQKPGGLLAFATAALDRTIATISDPASRPRRSPSALALNRLSIALDSPSSAGDPSPRFRRASNNSSTSTTPILQSPQLEAKQSSQLSLLSDPISRPYTETDPNRPLPIRLPGAENKMHQTSSRLLRMTDDDRPFTRVSIFLPSRPSRRAGIVLQHHAESSAVSLQHLAHMSSF